MVLRDIFIWNDCGDCIVFGDEENCSYVLVPEASVVSAGEVHTDTVIDVFLVQIFRRLDTHRPAQLDMLRDSVVCAVLSDVFDRLSSLTLYCIFIRTCFYVLALKRQGSSTVHGGEDVTQDGDFQNWLNNTQGDAECSLLKTEYENTCSNSPQDAPSVKDEAQSESCDWPQTVPSCANVN